ncbi:MAG: two-component system, cell cycle sensor histidine kinase and response regulator CckA [Chthoniobacter sp.]|jgi:two-component system cell cycle sensor histidine kinase/response regulator CckA|nr:two-component system, cell cycle sensor histidine kinase and response regulator CckA [Chthoniobacter sp.]
MHIQQSEFHEELVKGLAHKMNNILSLFHGYLGMLLDNKTLDEDTLAGLTQIRDGATAASELIDRTKVFAKSTSAVWREIDLEQLMRCLTPTMESFAERGVRLEINCDENLPRIWMEVSKLRTVIYEIVCNACEASPDGGVVTISARLEENPPSTNGEAGEPEPVSWVTITVSDSGEGISPEIEKKLFQPFFSTKRRQNALGLGLSVAAGLVQQLGGAIRISRNAGLTAFRVLLPARTAVA